jgi:hypothetical protein
MGNKRIGKAHRGGKAIPRMRMRTNPRCQKCGTVLPEAAKYCSNCGQRYVPHPYLVILLAMVLMFGILSPLEYWAHGSSQSVIVPGFLAATVLLTTGLVLRSLAIRKRKGV